MTTYASFALAPRFSGPEEPLALANLNALDSHNELAVRHAVKRRHSQIESTSKVESQLGDGEARPSKRILLGIDTSAATPAETSPFAVSMTMDTTGDAKCHERVSAPSGEGTTPAKSVARVVQFEFQKPEDDRDPSSVMQLSSKLQEWPNAICFKRGKAGPFFIAKDTAEMVAYIQRQPPSLQRFHAIPKHIGPPGGPERKRNESPLLMRCAFDIDGVLGEPLHYESLAKSFTYVYYAALACYRGGQYSFREYVNGNRTQWKDEESYNAFVFTAPQHPDYKGPPSLHIYGRPDCGDVIFQGPTEFAHFARFFRAYLEQAIAVRVLPADDRCNKIELMRTMFPAERYPKGRHSLCYMLEQATDDLWNTTCPNDLQTLVKRIDWDCLIHADQCDASTGWKSLRMAGQGKDGLKPNDMDASRHTEIVFDFQSLGKTEHWANNQKQPFKHERLSPDKLLECSHPNASVRLKPYRVLLYVRDLPHYEREAIGCSGQHVYTQAKNVTCVVVRATQSDTSDDARTRGSRSNQVDDEPYDTVAAIGAPSDRSILEQALALLPADHRRAFKLKGCKEFEDGKQEAQLKRVNSRKNTCLHCEVEHDGTNAKIAVMSTGAVYFYCFRSKAHGKESSIRVGDIENPSGRSAAHIEHKTRRDSRGGRTKMRKAVHIAPGLALGGDEQWTPSAIDPTPRDVAAAAAPATPFSWVNTDTHPPHVAGDDIGDKNDAISNANTNTSRSGGGRVLRTSPEPELDLMGIPEGHVVRYNEPGVRPFKDAFNHNAARHGKRIRCVIERSGMETGKTLEMVKYIEQHNAELPRIIVISTRITLASSLFARLEHLGFKHYKQIAAWDIDKADRLIIQWESLHKLRPHLGFDLVVCDEIESLMGNMICATTNKSNLGDNIRTFEQIHVLPSNASCGEPPKILLMDQDVSQKTIAVYTKMLDPEEICLRINRCVVLYRRIVVHQCDKCWQQVIVVDVNNKRRPYIHSGTRKRALALQAMLKRIAPNDVTMLFDSTMDDREKFAVSEDPDRKLVKVDNLIATAVLLQGTSFNVKNHFHRSFMFGSPNTTTPREEMQGIGRIRSPVDNTVHAVVSSAPRTNLETDPVKILKDIKFRAKHNKLANKKARQSCWMHDKTEELQAIESEKIMKRRGRSEDGKKAPEYRAAAKQLRRYERLCVDLENAPAWIVALMTHHYAERNRASNDWAGELVRHSEGLGYAVEFHECKELSKKQASAHRTLCNRDADEADEKAFNDTPLINAREADEIKRSLEQGMPLSRTDKWKMNKYNHQAHYKSPVDFKHFQQTSVPQIASKIKQTAMYLKKWVPAADGTGEQISAYLSDRNACRGQFSETVDFKCPRLTYMHELSHILGLEHALDTKTVIQPGVFDADTETGGRLLKLLRDKRTKPLIARNRRAADEEKLSSTDEVKPGEQTIKGLVDSLFGAFCYGHLTQVGTKRVGKRRKRTSTWGLSFGKKPMLEWATDCTYFDGGCS